MNRRKHRKMDASDISVYGEAKGEYTRQLCVFLVPCLETYFLELLEEAKTSSPAANKVLWHFQTSLQSIPDWNQDKVARETDKIQKDCKCDYLEELLTAVFIAHTKVLSAIRVTTKQKKLQITIPKIEHFLHRVLSDSARTLWTNAFLFAETNSIEKQKNLRQVSSLLQESVLQGIRGLLPVKSILREYLYENDGDEDDGEEKEEKEEEQEQAEEQAEATKESAVEPTVEPSSLAASVEPTVEPPVEPSSLAASVEPAIEPTVESAEATKEPEPAVEASILVASHEATKEPEPAAAKEPPAPTQAQAQAQSQAAQVPMIYIDTKPSVTFSNEHVMFDSDNLENNEIQDIPFAGEEDEDAIDSVLIMDEVLPMDSDEVLG
jgi:hypothetical protein